jgi:hypothetical protein
MKGQAKPSQAARCHRELRRPSSRREPYARSFGLSPARVEWSRVGETAARLAASPTGAGSGHGAIIWDFTTALHPLLISWVRFAGNAGLHWEIDMSLPLERPGKRTGGEVQHRARCSPARGADWSLPVPDETI